MIVTYNDQCLTLVEGSFFYLYFILLWKKSMELPIYAIGITCPTNMLPMDKAKGSVDELRSVKIVQNFETLVRSMPYETHIL